MEAGEVIKNKIVDLQQIKDELLELIDSGFEDENLDEALECIDDAVEALYDAADAEE